MGEKISYRVAHVGISHSSLSEADSVAETLSRLFNLDRSAETATAISLWDLPLKSWITARTVPTDTSGWKRMTWKLPWPNWPPEAFRSGRNLCPR